MIEVLFSANAAGSLKDTKLGNPVICLGWMLDIGRLDIAVDSVYRKNDFRYVFYERNSL